MPRIPRESTPESTLALARDPYRFISRRCREHGTDVFMARILLHSTLCMTGRDYTELFCDAARFQRAGAAPARLQKTLFGRGGVQGLDDEPHRHRKAMFVALAVPAQVDHLVAITGRWWQRYLARWAERQEIVLYGELHRLLTQAVCEWAGVPLPEAEVDQRTQDLTAMFDAAGDIGPRHWRARLARKRANRWVGRLVQAIRKGEYAPPAGSAAHRIAWHRDLDGELLPSRIAAVELLNVLRPTVAVSVYMVFAAVALHTYPDVRARVENGEPDYTTWFVQEVRRFYPFFPAVTAVVRKDFEWRDYPFFKGTPAILDLYGTNHDPRVWSEPDDFKPERFARWDEDPYAFIPQGGGEVRKHHRCPGEPIAVALTRQAVEFLTGAIRYDLPRQDLATDMTRTPALPRSGFLMSRVRAQKGDQADSVPQ